MRWSLAYDRLLKALTLQMNQDPEYSIQVLHLSIKKKILQR